MCDVAMKCVCCCLEVYVMLPLVMYDVAVKCV